MLIVSGRLRTIFIFLELILAILVLLSQESLAQFRASETKENRAFVYHGRVLRPTGEGITGSLQLTVRIFSPEPALCLLWSETQTVKLEKGAFAVEIGHSTFRISGANGGIAQDFKQAFINNSSMVLSNAQCAV